MKYDHSLHFFFFKIRNSLFIYAILTCKIQLVNILESYDQVSYGISSKFYHK